jgi:hypothetical protein
MSSLSGQTMRVGDMNVDHVKMNDRVIPISKGLLEEKGVYQPNLDTRFVYGVSTKNLWRSSH